MMMRSVIEKEWKAWWMRPDVNGQLSGVDLLRQNLRMEWVCGEYLNQITSDPAATTPVKLRLLAIHPSRLATPPAQGGTADVVLGIKRTTTGKPIEYYVMPDLSGPLAFANPYMPETLRAADVIHGFDSLEPGQARGIPKLGSALEKLANLDDYDVQVMDAARAAADNGVLLYSDHEDAKFVNVNESTEHQRRTIRTLPPGWRATQMTPQQPGTQYIEFHDETLRKAGRGVSMPLMRIKLDSRDHNYSSARFDSNVYGRAIEAKQEKIESDLLNRLFLLWLREAELGWARKPETRAFATRPEGLRNQWMWEPLPDVDAEKEARGRTERLKNGTSCMRDECDGDWEDVLEQQAREREKRIALGVPEPAYSAQAPTDAADAADEAARKAKEQDEEEREAAEIRSRNRYRKALV
jgi:lambda family phage portal protein